MVTLIHAEQPMLKNFPTDFRYILGLQEASVVGMADGYAQATRRPAVAVLHTAAGTGNGMGNIMTAFLNKTPLIIIAGQQTRQMLIGDPYLTDRDATMLPQPWVKWAYQPARAEDVPAALVRAIAIASMPPAGPVFLSIPLDDWVAEIESAPVIRTVALTTAPNPERLSKFAARISKARNFALVLGQEVDKSLGWKSAVALAELLGSPVFQAPLAERAVFPETHPLFKGSLPLARGPLSTALSGFDLVLVVGAEVWRYYPYAAGPVSPPGLELLQITNDPHDAGSALVGDSLLSDARLALEGLYNLLHNTSASSAVIKQKIAPKSATASAKSKVKNATALMTASEAFTAAALLRAELDILVQETPSNVGDLLNAWPIVREESYFTSASGGLGWGGPAAVGIALAQNNRTTVLAIGDGSLHYSVQSIYTAVQHKLNLIILVPRNEEYAILKEFAIFENTPKCRKFSSESHDFLHITESRYSCFRSTGTERESDGRGVWLYSFPRGHSRRAI
jgi:benzoylformate decarboxylase